MFNFSYEYFLNKESETESKKSQNSSLNSSIINKNILNSNNTLNNIND